MESNAFQPGLVALLLNLLEGRRSSFHMESCLPFLLAKYPLYRLVRNLSSTLLLILVLESLRNAFPFETVSLYARLNE